MAGETIKSSGICLRISPWSQTSHVVAWITPHGRLNTLVKGAVRPKSAFLGQYDLNYSCEIVYYARGLGELRTLKESWPTDLRPELREDLPSLALADRFRRLVELICPNGPDAASWYSLLGSSLDALVDNLQKDAENRINPLALLVDFEMKILDLAGISPEISGGEGAFYLRGERKIPVSRDVARTLQAPLREKNIAFLLDAARVIGVFYQFHVDNGVEGRRQVLQLISKFNY